MNTNRSCLRILLALIYLTVASVTTIAYALRIVYAPGAPAIRQGDEDPDAWTGSGLKMRKRHIHVETKTFSSHLHSSFSFNTPARGYTLLEAGSLYCLPLHSVAKSGGDRAPPAEKELQTTAAPLERFSTSYRFADASPLRVVFPLPVQERSPLPTPCAEAAVLHDRDSRGRGNRPLPNTQAGFRFHIYPERAG